VLPEIKFEALISKFDTILAFWSSKSECVSTMFEYGFRFRWMPELDMAGNVYFNALNQIQKKNEIIQIIVDGLP
jgi:hypothetical protein